MRCNSRDSKVVLEIGVRFYEGTSFQRFAVVMTCAAWVSRVRNAMTFPFLRPPIRRCICPFPSNLRVGVARVLQIDVSVCKRCLGPDADGLWGTPRVGRGRDVAARPYCLWPEDQRTDHAAAGPSAPGRGRVSEGSVRRPSEARRAGSGLVDPISSRRWVLSYPRLLPVGAEHDGPVHSAHVFASRELHEARLLTLCGRLDLNIVITFLMLLYD